MVDKSIVTPLYEQVADELRKEILDYQYGDQGCIGTHTQLAERFNVSLRTIRTAAQLLEREGLVDIQQGKGTFVRRTAVVDQLQELTVISNVLSNQGVKTTVAVPEFCLIDTPDWLEPDVIASLGSQCLFIRRVILVEGQPVANTDMYLPGKYFPMMSKSEVEANTVYQIYQNKLGIELGRGRQVIRAAGVTGDVARSLQLEENSPVLRIERKAYDSQKNLIEYMILTCEPSTYCFEVELELSKQR